MCTPQSHNLYGMFDKLPELDDLMKLNAKPSWIIIIIKENDKKHESTPLLLQCTVVIWKDGSLYSLPKWTAVLQQMHRKRMCVSDALSKWTIPKMEAEFAATNNNLRINIRLFFMSIHHLVSDGYWQVPPEQICKSMVPSQLALMLMGGWKMINTLQCVLTTLR